MPKHYLNQNVCDASIERIQYTFDNFEKIYLSFSAGKDSTVMLHLVMDEAIKRNQKIGLLIVDLEGQYKLTIDHMTECIEMYKSHLDVYWVCLPIHLRNAVSVFKPFWKCWDKEVEKAGNRFRSGLLDQDIYGSNGYYIANVLPEIKYVHQLQNLYFALTGEELTIK